MQQSGNGSNFIPERLIERRLLSLLWTGSDCTFAQLVVSVLLILKLKMIV